jgi:hypothetical protein
MKGTKPLTPKQLYDRARYARRRAEQLKYRAADPIESLTPEERAYLAGLIDGEGSIFVSAVGPHRKKTVYPIVCIGMTHRGVIEWLAARLRSGKVQIHNQTNLRRYGYMKPQYRFQLFGKRAKLLCAALLPYLRVKDRQAQLVSSFPIEGRVAPGVKLSEEMNQLRYELRDQINSLNHEGCPSYAGEKRRSFARSP